MGNWRSNRPSWRWWAALVVALLLAASTYNASTAENWSFGDDVVYFFTPACSICREIEPALKSITDTHGVQLRKLDLTDPESLKLMMSLLKARDLPPETAGISPSAFTSDAHLIGFMNASDFASMLEGVSDSRVRSQALWGGTFVAGLVDGVNPCTLNVLLVLLSVCAMADKRHVLPMGLTFVCGVSSAYITVGLGLGKILAPLQQLGPAVPLLYLVMAVLLIAFFVRPDVKVFSSIKRVLGRQIGRLRSPSMGYLPVFAMGLLSSAFEFVCSGQVYIPVVMYLSTHRAELMVAHLLLYNLAFALPMLLMVVAMAVGSNSVNVQNTLKRPWLETASRTLMLVLGTYLFPVGAMGIRKFLG
jgi:cytochrome c biogenesis protein CcdA